MDRLFRNISFRSSRLITEAYSTSFSIGVKCIDASIRDGIYGIYGFVRFADEIVDTFHQYDREELLLEFEEEYYRSLERGISMNPVINAFQLTVRKYQIPDDLVQSFMNSMKCDLYMSEFGEEEIRQYIYGSADVVGLMCLKVFVRGNNDDYERLKPFAMRLGSAFQKINFLRDIRHDTNNLHRVYFPVLKHRPLDEDSKKIILDDIHEDYQVALQGIKELPECARLGVYTAYLYYKSLTKQISRTRAEKLMEERIRISNAAKMFLLGQAYLYAKFY